MFEGFEVEGLTLAKLWAYARCPFRYFWRYEARIAPPPGARGLVERTLRQALSLHYDASSASEDPGLVRCLGVAWRRMVVDEWGYGSDVWDLLTSYAAKRAEILEPFLAGRVTKPDGAPYKVPEMSAAYERSAAKAGLPALAERLKELLARAPILADGTYTVADAFADSVEAADRGAWPAPDAVIGVGVPCEADLLEGLMLRCRADLILDAGGGKAAVEVHDYAKPVCLPIGLLRRDLRVAAASRARSEGWSEVGEVIYRHIRSGKTVRLSPRGDGRLLTAAIGAAAGIRHGVYVPRMAVQDRACLSCPFQELCAGEREDILDTLDPTLLARIRDLQGR